MALDTNWRENGDTFVCARSGDDATGDGSKANPYKTVRNIGSSGKQIIRAGFYKAGGFNSGNFNFPGTQWIGDGKVVIDASNFTEFNKTGDKHWILLNLTLINGNLIAGGGSKRTNNTFDCILQGLTHQKAVTERSLYKDCTVDLNSSFLATFINSTVNSYVTRNARKSAFDNCTISLSDIFDNCAFVDNCTLGGTLIKDRQLDADSNTIGNTYASNERFSGTIGGVTFTNCFYTDDPMFNDPANEDYTLQSNLSPLFNNGNIIGCYGVADKFDLSHPAFQTANGATYTNISGLDGNGDPVGGGTPLGIASGTDAMFSTSDDPTQCFTLSNTITITDPVQWFGQFIYNNGQWIDTANYDAVANQEVRLTYGIQFYDENEPNGVNDLANWSKTYQMEVNMPIERDAADLGNGNVDADMDALGAVTFKRFRLVNVTLRNNGV